MTIEVMELFMAAEMLDKVVDGYEVGQFEIDATDSNKAFVSRMRGYAIKDEWFYMRDKYIVLDDMEIMRYCATYLRRVAEQLEMSK